MNAENNTQTNEKNYLFKDFKSYKYHIQLALSGDQNNCKLSYIHSAGNLAQITDDKEKIEVVNWLLGRAKGRVIINTTNEQVWNFLKTNYEYYYAHKVPCGYGSSFQYDICIRNVIILNQNCRAPVKEIEIDKEIIREKLLTILKAKKRKTDYVNEFIKSL